MRTAFPSSPVRRVAVVNCASGHVRPSGGLEVRLLTWARWLASAGVEVSFCSLADGSATPAGGPTGTYRLPGEPFTRHVFATVEDLADHVERVDAASVHQWVDQLTHPEKSVFMVHADLATCYPYAFGDRLTSAQSVLFTGAAVPAGRDPSLYSAPALVASMRQAAVLATCSDFASASVSAVTHRPVQTLYAAVHDEFFAVQQQAPRPVVAFVGRLTVHKGGDVLLAAVAAGAFDAYPLELSDFSSDPELAARVAALAAAGAPVVLRQGTHSRHELARYMAGVRAVLVPSLYEGFGTVVVEALAAGTPVVCSDVGGLPEACAQVTTPSRWLVPVGDASVLAAGVEQAVRVRVPETERAAVRARFGLEATGRAYLGALELAASGG